MAPSSQPPKTQADKFKELARELEADEDEAHWDKRLEKVAKAKPAPGKPSEGPRRCAVGLALASPAAAQGTGQAKMLLIHNQGIAVTDFPNMARCEVARRAILRAIAEDNANRPLPEAVPGGDTIVTLPTAPPKMVCAPA
jgi:hypothetical protein